MGVKDEVLGFTLQQGPKCTVFQAMEKLDPKTVKELNEVFVDKSVQNTALSRWFGAKGSRVSSSAISRHRLGQCNCGH